MAFDFINEKLVKQQVQHRYRQRTFIEAIEQQYIRIAGKNYINFSSNDYLGLNQHPDINKAFQQGIDKFGLCSTGSPLISGHLYTHHKLEEDICQWLNMPACLLFTSGFAANNGFLQALAQPNTNLFLDKLSHASLIDGALTSKATTKRFLHNDLNQLEQYLNKKTDSDNLIISEGIFSMDGDQAPVKELYHLAKKHNALLYLDEAHSIGVIGEQGEGCTSMSEIDVVMATFGKAIATSGAFIACSENLKEYLVNFCRHYIFSTAMSPAIAMATSASIEIIKKESWRRERIKKLSEMFISLLDCHVHVLPTQSSIHALIIGDEEKALKMSDKIKQQGFWLSAIRPPTVPKNSSRLRVTICANHKDNEIKQLAEIINKANYTC